ncbi:class I SAM-dependent methyltransferase [Paenibacillus protaetiae]|uniref:class I SAM-dependent methyltransferase n=1 Tax=Paenibacillus protaetiae TaxID=2509456 RepID=UPI0013EA0B25|nr:class I SAM-dependent methyltransferase [Paenibacillus protaetiae]
MNQVIGYYQATDEDSRFSRNSRKIEFLTTTDILDRIVPPGSAILDVGAGTGVYSFYYAEKGHDVTAVDLTPKHIDMIQRKRDNYASDIKLKAAVGDATDLSEYESEMYDVALCFGPVYHLVEEEARNRCFRECLRVLKPGGILAAAYINKFDVMPMLATRDASFLRESVVDKMLNEGVIRSGDADCFWTDAYFTSPDEMEQLLARFGVQVIDHAATDGLSHTIGDHIDRLTDEQFHVWVNYHKRTCRERTIMGISSHGLIAGRKAL